MISSDNFDSSESDKSESLESAIDLLEVFMILFTGVVVLGLLIELITPFQKLLGDHDWKDFLYSSAGAVLVTIGVAGECAVAFWSFRKGHKLRDVNAERERRSNERIAEAEKKTAEALLETEKIKAQLAWRVLTVEQTNTLIIELSEKRCSIIIERYDGDIESTHLYNQLRHVFSVARWTIGWRSCGGGYLVISSLVVMPSSTSPESVNEAVALVNALNLVGLHADFFEGDISSHWSRIVQSDLLPEPALRLFIGVKRPTP